LRIAGFGRHSFHLNIYGLLALSNSVQKFQNSRSLLIVGFPVPNCDRHQCIFKTGKLIEQIVGLKDKSDLFASEVSQTVFVKIRNIDVIYEYLSGSRNVESTQNV